MMQDTDQLDERIRAADPAIGIDRDPATPRGRRIRARIGRQVRPSAPRRGVPRRRVVVTIAAAVLMLGSVAVATGVFEPDPEQVSSILEDAEARGLDQVKTEDWRPNLRAEQVWCAYEDGVVGSTRTFEFALDEPMKQEHLIAACTDGPDQHRAVGGDAPTEFTVCEAYAPPAEVRRAIDSPGRWTEVSGDVSGDRPGFPVVLGWDADCSQVTLDTNSPVVELRPWTSTDAVNRTREIEIHLTATAVEDCISRDEAYAMAEDAEAYLDGDWLIAERPHQHPDCHRVWVDPQLGVLEIGAPG